MVEKFSSFVILFCIFCSCEKKAEFQAFKNAKVVDTNKVLNLTELSFKATRNIEPQNILSDKKINLIFFGFPGCHGVCPTTLAALERELSGFTKGHQYQLLFINVDPDASVQKVKDFLNSYKINSVGILPADRQTLKKMARLFGAFSREAFPGEKITEKIIHSPQLFLVSAQGKWVGYYSFPILSGVLKSDLKNFLM